MGADDHEVLATLITVHKEINEDVPYHQWFQFGEYYPPYTVDSIVVFNNYGRTGSIEIAIASTFLQHYLLAKYYYGFKKRPLMAEYSHFMRLSDPR